MEIKIVEEKENPFFKRKELRVELKHESSATPSKSELTKIFADKYSVDPSQVVVDYLFTKKGLAESAGKIKILKEKPKIQETPKKEEKNETQTSSSEQAAKQ